MTASGGSALAAAVRVIDGVHDDAPDRRADTFPPIAARLADRHLFMVDVSDLPDRRHALDEDKPDLAGGEAKVRIRSLLGQDLRDRTGGPGDLSALPDLEFDVVHERPDRDVADREGVSGLDVGAGARKNLVADGNPDRTEDVPLLPVRVVQQRKARGPVRVVFDGRDGRRDVLLVSLEVDDPVPALVAPAAVPHRGLAEVVPPAASRKTLRQRAFGLLLRQIVHDEDGHAPSSGEVGL